MPQAFPEKAEELVSADIVTGNKDHKKIVNLIEQYKEKNDRVIEIDRHEKGDKFEDFSISSFEGRNRAFIKIQDGCDRYCSYCIIPTSRGRSRSRSLESLSEELDSIKKNDFKEVVLVGINFCCYGLDIGHTFVDAIELACSKGFDRVRIGSLEFDNISDEAISRMAKLENFCPQFHISLQSGCDNTLKAMNRHYTSAEYKELCEKLRKNFKDTSITTDLMVGFPTETDEDFEASLNFAKEIGFEKIHVFPYSRREGTKAAEMKPQVPGPVKTERAHRMIETANEIREKFFQEQVGKTVEVLCESYDEKDKMWAGYTKNYTPVKFPGETDLKNQLVQVKITGVDVENDVVIGIIS